MERERQEAPSFVGILSLQVQSQYKGVLSFLFPENEDILQDAVTNKR